MELKLKKGPKYTRNMSIWVDEVLWHDVQTVKSELEGANDHYRKAIAQVTEHLKQGVTRLKGAKA